MCVKYACNVYICVLATECCVMCTCIAYVCVYSVCVCLSAFRCLLTPTLLKDTLEWIICSEAYPVWVWPLNHFIHEPCFVAVTSAGVGNIVRDGPQDASSYMVASYFRHSLVNYTISSREPVIFLDSVSRMCVLPLCQELTCILKHSWTLADNARVVPIPTTCYLTLLILIKHALFTNISPYVLLSFPKISMPCKIF